MRKIVTAAAVIITLAFAPLTQADSNILTNADFEDGTTGWQSRSCTMAAVTSPVYAGTYSAAAYNRTANWQGIQQDVQGKMVAGETYTVSGYVRTSTAEDASVQITFQQTDGGNDGQTQYFWAAAGTADSSGWTYLSGSFTLTVTGTLTELLVYIEGPEAGINLYVDNLQVYGPEVSPVEPTAAGTVDINTRHQTMDGFGAAGAWYESTLVSLGSSQPEIYDVLFGDLGLDIYRLRNAYDQDDAAGYMSRSATIIDKAETSLGQPIKTLICAWSPSASLKSNGTTGYGGTLTGGPDAYDYDDYADWWADSITAWASYGIEADYISIQNEPDWSADWDSCRFEPTETDSYAGYAEAFEAVYAEMNSRFGDDAPRMIGPETTGLTGAAGSTPSDYISALVDPSHAYGYAHHLYNYNAGDAPDDYLSAMQTFNAAWGDKPLFQTEYEKTTTVWPDALDMALLLHNSLTIEEVSAYLYWDLFWGTAGSGMVYITSSSYTIYNDYYGFKHYSAFIHADWQRVEADDDSDSLRISAFIAPDDSRLTVVILNTDTETDIELTLSFADAVIASGDIYRTRETENCVHTGTFDPASPVVTLPAESITTLSLTLNQSESLYGDFDDSGTVDIDDLLQLAAAWMDEDCDQLDLDGDCSIGLHEFARFAQNWLQSSP